MTEGKMVTVVTAGGGRSVEAIIYPGDEASQICTIVAPDLGLPSDGRYHLWGPDGNPITSNVYMAVKDGDKLTLLVQYG